MRLAVGGFEHETNTFAPVGAGFVEFEQPDAWPGLTRGEGLFEAVAGINLPVIGFVRARAGRGRRAGTALPGVPPCPPPMVTAIGRAISGIPANTFAPATAGFVEFEQPEPDPA